MATSNKFLIELNATIKGLTGPLKAAIAQLQTFQKSMSSFASESNNSMKKAADSFNANMEKIFVGTSKNGKFRIGKVWKDSIAKQLSTALSGAIKEGFAGVKITTSNVMSDQQWKQIFDKVGESAIKASKAKNKKVLDQARQDALDLAKGLASMDKYSVMPNKLTSAAAVTAAVAAAAPVTPKRSKSAKTGLVNQFTIEEWQIQDGIRNLNKYSKMSDAVLGKIGDVRRRRTETQHKQEQQLMIGYNDKKEQLLLTYQKREESALVLAGRKKYDLMRKMNNQYDIVPVTAVVRSSKQGGNNGQLQIGYNGLQTTTQNNALAARLYGANGRNSAGNQGNFVSPTTIVQPPPPPKDPYDFTNLKNAAGNFMKSIADVQPAEALIDVLKNGISNAIGVMMSAMKMAIGVVAAMSAAFVGAGYILKDYIMDVLNVTERMRSYNIALSGLMGTQTNINNLMKTAVKVTEDLPIAYDQVFESTKAFALISPLRPMLRDTANLETNLKELNGIVLSLSQIEPEWGIKGAIFSLREALSGDLLSLKRRFEIPVNVITTVDGKKLTDVKNDPKQVVKALSNYLGQFYGPKELEATSKQFGVVLAKIEGFYTQFRAQIGNSGIYDVVVNDLIKARDIMKDFVNSNDAVRIAQDISDAMVHAYKQIIRLFDNIVGIFSDISSKSGLEQVTSAFQLLTDIVTKYATILEGLANIAGSKEFRSLLIEAWNEGTKYVMKLYVAIVDLFKFLRTNITNIYNDLTGFFSGIENLIPEKYMINGAIFVMFFGVGNSFALIRSSFAVITSGLTLMYETMKAMVLVDVGSKIVPGAAVIGGWDKLKGVLSSIKSMFLIGLEIAIFVELVTYGIKEVRENWENLKLYLNPEGKTFWEWLWGSKKSKNDEMNDFLKEMSSFKAEMAMMDADSGNFVGGVSKFSFTTEDLISGNKYKALMKSIMEEIQTAQKELSRTSQEGGWGFANPKAGNLDNLIKMANKLSYFRQKAIETGIATEDFKNSVYATNMVVEEAGKALEKTWPKISDVLNVPSEGFFGTIFGAMTSSVSSMNEELESSVKYLERISLLADAKAGIGGLTDSTKLGATKVGRVMEEYFGEGTAGITSTSLHDNKNSLHRKGIKVDYAPIANQMDVFGDSKQLGKFAMDLIESGVSKFNLEEKYADKFKNIDDSILKDVNAAIKKNFGVDDFFEKKTGGNGKGSAAHYDVLFKGAGKLGKVAKENFFEQIYGVMAKGFNSAEGPKATIKDTASSEMVKYKDVITNANLRTKEYFDFVKQVSDSREQMIMGPLDEIKASFAGAKISFGGDVAEEVQSRIRAASADITDAPRAAREAYVQYVQNLMFDANKTMDPAKIKSAIEKVAEENTKFNSTQEILEASTKRTLERLKEDEKEQIKKGEMFTRQAIQKEINGKDFQFANVAKDFQQEIMFKMLDEMSLASAGKNPNQANNIRQAYVEFKQSILEGGTFDDGAKAVDKYAESIASLYMSFKMFGDEFSKNTTLMNKDQQDNFKMAAGGLMSMTMGMAGSGLSGAILGDNKNDLSKRKQFIEFMKEELKLLGLLNKEHMQEELFLKSMEETKKKFSHSNIADMKEAFSKFDKLDRATRTAGYERYKSRLEREGSSVSSGEVFQTGMASAVNEFKTFKEQMFEAGADLTNGLASTFETGFFDVMSGNIANLGDMFQSMGREILSTIGKIIAKMMAISLTKIVLGVDMNASGSISGSAGGGILNNLVGNLFSGVLGGGSQAASATGNVMGIGTDVMGKVMGAAGGGFGGLSQMVTGGLGAGAVSKIGAGKILGSGGSLSKLWGGAKSFMSANPWVLPAVGAGLFLSQPGRLFGGTKDKTQGAQEQYAAAIGSVDEMKKRRSDDATKYVGSGYSDYISKFNFANPSYSTWSSGDGWFGGPKEKHAATDTASFDASMKQYYLMLKYSAQDHAKKMREIDQLKEANNLRALQEEQAIKLRTVNILGDQYQIAQNTNDWATMDRLRDEMVEAGQAWAESFTEIAEEFRKTANSKLSYENVRGMNSGIADQQISLKEMEYNMSKLTVGTREWYDAQIEYIGASRDMANTLKEQSETIKGQVSTSLSSIIGNKFITGNQGSLNSSLSTISGYNNLAGMSDENVMYRYGKKGVNDIYTETVEEVRTRLAEQFQHEMNMINVMANQNEGSYRYTNLFTNDETKMFDAAEMLKSQISAANTIFQTRFNGVNPASLAGADLEFYDSLKQTLSTLNLEVIGQYEQIAEQAKAWMASGYVGNIKDIVKLPLEAVESVYKDIAYRVRQGGFKSGVLGTVKGMESTTDFSGVYSQFKTLTGSSQLDGINNLMAQTEDPFEAWYNYTKDVAMQKFSNAESGSQEWFDAQQELFDLLAERADHLKQKAEDSTKKMEEMLESIDATMKTRVAEESKTSKGDVIFFDIGGTRDAQKQLDVMLSAIKTNDPKAKQMIEEFKKRMMGMKK